MLMEAAEISKLLFLKPSKYLFCISFHIGTLNKFGFQYTAEKLRPATRRRNVFVFVSRMPLLKQGKSGKCN